MATGPSAIAKLVREQRYRRHHLEAETTQTARALGLLNLGFFLTLRNDFLLLRGAQLGVTLAAKALHLVVVVAALIALRQTRSPRRADVATATVLASTALVSLQAVTTRLARGEFQGPSFGLVAMLAIIYFAMRGPVLPRALTGVTLTAAGLLTIWNPRAPITPVGRETSTVSFAILNALGVLTARALEAQARRSFAADLEQRRAQRALEEKVRELAAEKERVETLSRARAAFLATMSHEFRTPMNAVIGLSDLLADAPLAGTHREYVTTIRDSARALLALLNDILDFAKIDARKLTLADEPVELPRLAASVVEMLRPAASQRALALALELGPALPARVRGDGARLRQVLVNLVSNAVKFTERGAVTLRLDAETTDAGAHAVTFRVEDTGIGIDPATLARLFQPFEQGDEGTTRRYGGTGLGLAISREIVAAMGGAITVESTPGRGSVFAFTLAFTPAEAAPATAPQPAVEPPAAPAPLAILVVDDHPINRRVAQAMIARLGYAVDLACDGPEAIAAAARRDYDVIFMDVQLPGMSGIEAAEQIRAARRGAPGPRLVAMTASMFEDERAACRRAGMADFIGKPIDLAHLEAVLRAAAHERRRSGAMPAAAATTTAATTPAIAAGTEGATAG